MHKKRMLTLIWVLAACMLVLVCYFIFRVETPLRDHIIFSETVHGLTIEPYYDETDDMYYLFLPAYVSEGDIQIKRDGFVQVDFADDDVDYGNSLEEVPLCEDVTLTIKNFGKVETYTYQIWQSENLPTIYLETESGSLDYVNEDKENEEQASVLMINEDGSVEYSGLTTLTGRGNTTWNQAKKPYNLKFDKEIDLWDLGNAKTWCLLANYSDASRMRNALGLYTASGVGIEYTSSTEFVSLYINGGYCGLYNVVTKQLYKEDTDKVCAVFEQSENEGDYISKEGSYISFQYGDEEFIQSIVDSFEEVLFKGGFYEEIETKIDIQSFAEKYLAEEFLANIDNRKSQYFAIDEDGKIYAICAWDYDLTLGSSWSKYFDVSYNYSVMNQSYSNNWYKTLFQYEEFRDEVIRLLDQNMEFLKNEVINYMGQSYAVIENDWMLDYMRWKYEEPFSNGITELKSDVDLSTLENQTTYIRSFVEKRISFLNKFWNNPEQFCQLSFNDSTVTDASVYVERGMLLTDDMLPDGLMKIVDEGFLGWYTENGINITDIGIVTQDMTFYGMWEESSGE